MVLMDPIRRQGIVTMGGLAWDMQGLQRDDTPCGMANWFA